MSEQTERVAEIRMWLSARCAEATGVSLTEIDVDAPLAECGLTSREALTLLGALEDFTGERLSPVAFYEFPTIQALSEHLASPGVSTENASHSLASIPPPFPVAIIGAGCRMPGASSPAELWQLLIDGREAICELPTERARLERRTGAGVRAGYLGRVDLFDAAFFSISENEARQIDPQQRLLLEVAWEALESGGQAMGRLRGSRTGVFVGISANDYSAFATRDALAPEVYAITGNALSIAANRISYFLDLRGPSVAVDTACSSSLVAVHLACQALRNGDCATAIVAGVNLILDDRLSASFLQAGLLSPDSRCKTFDARANGYVRGEGAVALLLKPLDAALRDGDSIISVIRGSATNSDGRSNGLMAPNGLAQEAVVRAACRAAVVEPTALAYVELHGTGTVLGDPVEAAALGRAIGPRGDDAKCAVGSIKSNCGHLEAGSGLAGLLKTALITHKGLIPSSLHFEQANPHIDFSLLPIRVQTGLSPLRALGSGGALAGVSSFGFGGSNAHVILQAPPLATRAEEPVSQGRWLIVVSARTPAALRERAARMSQFVRESDSPLSDIMYSSIYRSTVFQHRCAVIASSRAELARGLVALAELPLSGSSELVFGDDSGALADWARRFVRKEVQDCHELERETGRWVALPTYPWQVKSYWVESTPESTSPSVATLQVAGDSRLHVWESTLDPGVSLLEHRIFDLPVAAAAHYVRLVGEAALATFDQRVSSMNEVSYEQPLSLAHAATVQVNFANIAPSLHYFRLYSRQGRSSWVLNAHGRITLAPEPAQQAGS